MLLRDVSFELFCEHHMAPIIGRAHISYLPDNRVVGISKLARLVDTFARRLQVQERLTAEIAETLNAVLKPRGVAVIIEATHHCMTTRGVHKSGESMITNRMLGAFRKDPRIRQEFLAAVRLQAREQREGGHDVEVILGYEAGYDGFWLQRRLAAEGITCWVMDPGSLQVDRRARRAKTDRLDAAMLLRP